MESIWASIATHHQPHEYETMGMYTVHVGYPASPVRHSRCLRWEVTHTFRAGGLLARRALMANAWPDYGLQVELRADMAQRLFINEQQQTRQIFFYCKWRMLRALLYKICSQVDFTHFPWFLSEFDFENFCQSSSDIVLRIFWIRKSYERAICSKGADFLPLHHTNCFTFPRVCFVLEKYVQVVEHGIHKRFTQA